MTPLFVDRIAYDAKGQRVLVAYGNGVMTRHAYDPDTFRLRATAQRALHHRWHHLPADRARRSRTSATTTTSPATSSPSTTAPPEAASPATPAPSVPATKRRGGCSIGGDALDRQFSYDPICRLVMATGRESDRPAGQPPWQDQPRGTDITRTAAYTERYHYDATGSLLRLEHTRTSGVHPRVRHRPRQQPAAPNAGGGTTATTTRSTPTAT